MWFPLQRSVERRVSKYGPGEAKRRQSLFSHYLHHCNIKVVHSGCFTCCFCDFYYMLKRKKDCLNVLNLRIFISPTYFHCFNVFNIQGFVFLETYDLKEYNPFLLSIKQPRYFKVILFWLKHFIYCNRKAALCILIQLCKKICFCGKECTLCFIPSSVQLNSRTHSAASYMKDWRVREQPVVKQVPGCFPLSVTQQEMWDLHECFALSWGIHSGRLWHLWREKHILSPIKKKKKVFTAKWQACMHSTQINLDPYKKPKLKDLWSLINYS